MKLLIILLLTITETYAIPIQRASGTTMLYRTTSDYGVACLEQYYEDGLGKIEQDARSMCKRLSGSENVLSLHDIVRGEGQVRHYTRDMQEYIVTECFVRWKVVCEVRG